MDYAAAARDDMAVKRGRLHAAPTASALRKPSEGQWRAASRTLTQGIASWRCWPCQAARPTQCTRNASYHSVDAVSAAAALLRWSSIAVSAIITCEDITMISAVTLLAAFLGAAAATSQGMDYRGLVLASLTPSRSNARNQRCLSARLYLVTCFPRAICRRGLPAAVQGSTRTSERPRGRPAKPHDSVSDDAV
jgi:hypothetical protein